MTKQIKLTTLLLFVTALTFAQRNPPPPPQNPPIRGVGVVVKKNPGSGASRVVTEPINEKGVSSFTIAEKGNYVISLTSPSNGQAKNQGGPIQGVKVSLGKNPPGARVALGVTNDKGEVEFKGLAAGNYFIDLVNTEPEPLTPVKEIPKEVKKTAIKTGE